MGIPLAIAGAAGTALSAYGQYEGGQATQAQMAYQAQVAQNNAQIDKQNALWDIQAGETAANARGMKTRANVGSAVASTAAGGVTTGVGSAAQVVQGVKQEGMLDALTIRSNSAKEAYGQEVKATSDTAQAQLDTMEGEQAAKGGELSAIGSLLSGGGSTAGNYAKYANLFG